MKQTIITGLVVLVILGLLSIVILGSRNKKTEPIPVQSSQESFLTTKSTVNDNNPIFFCGNTCPHCEDVEEWMKENKIEEKIEIVKKEVYDDKTNALELARIAKSCGMDTSTIGVPFLYAPEGKCLIGTPDIVGYLSDRAGISANNKATESGKEDEL